MIGGVQLTNQALQCFVDACGRKPARPTATTTTTTQATTEVTTIYTERWLNCSSEEIQKTGCLNGGRCFAMLLGGTRVSACQCPASYTGRRCQEINYLPARSNNRLRTAGIAAGISSLLLILVFGVCVFVIFIRRKRKSVPNGQQRVTQGCPVSASFLFVLNTSGEEMMNLPFAAISMLSLIMCYSTTLSFPEKNVAGFLSENGFNFV
ncbi:unnamed protein product [Acanthosepion pharaonis]|uniref:EGF-like domain-containing protein n=1 Tax=Acanthosepion pharaonis TaxID=158019 RepID=A0A812CR65_ACAPH|nr:unnamed protein product [Sepia pharaonis]